MEIFTSTNDDNIQNNALGVGCEIKFSHYTQERDYDIRSTTLKNIYAQLELSYDLIRATTPVYTKYTYKQGQSYSNVTGEDRSLAASAIKGASKKAKIWISVDVDAASVRGKTSRESIIRKLNDWNEAGVIELKPGGVLNVYKIVNPLPTKPEAIEKLVSSLYATLEQREQEALNRTEEMLQLITGQACFSRALAQHFGDDLPPGMEECGQCTWCLTYKPVVQQLLPPVEFNTAAFETILSQIPHRDDPRLLARIAFGISSPQVTAMKMSKSSLFGSMDDHNFMVSISCLGSSWVNVCIGSTARLLSKM